jgi:hypothetical protein
MRERDVTEEEYDGRVVFRIEKEVPEPTDSEFRIWFCHIRPDGSASELGHMVVRVDRSFAGTVYERINGTLVWAGSMTIHAATERMRDRNCGEVHREWASGEI